MLIIVLEITVIITEKRKATNERKGENNIKYFQRFLIKFHFVVFSKRYDFTGTIAQRKKRTRRKRGEKKVVKNEKEERQRQKNLKERKEDEKKYSARINHEQFQSQILKNANTVEQV